MLKRLTGGGAYLRGLASGQHSSEETSQRWRAVGRFDRPKNQTSNLPHIGGGTGGGRRGPGPLTFFSGGALGRPYFTRLFLQY